MENVDNMMMVGSFGGETIVEVDSNAEDAKEIGRGLTTATLYMGEVNEYPLTVRVENNGDLDEDLSSSIKNYFRLQFGILFCPKMVCTIDTKTGSECEVPTVEMDPDGTSGICFEIFTKIFEKLKEKNLVRDFYLDELECELEAFHPDHIILENISSMVSSTHFGFGFWLGNIPKTREICNDELTFLIEVQNILIELKSEYTILEKEEMKLQYQIECCFHN